MQEDTEGYRMIKDDTGGYRGIHVIEEDTELQEIRFAWNSLCSCVDAYVLEAVNATNMHECIIEYECLNGKETVFKIT